MAYSLLGGLQNPPAEAGCCFSPPPFRFGQAATPTAPCQGEKHPLTGLVYVAFRLQRNGSGGSSFTIVRCLLHDFLFFYPWVFLIVAMGTSNCHLTKTATKEFGVAMSGIGHESKLSFGHVGALYAD